MDENNFDFYISEKEYKSPFDPPKCNEPYTNDFVQIEGEKLIMAKIKNSLIRAMPGLAMLNYEALVPAEPEIPVRNQIINNSPFAPQDETSTKDISLKATFDRPPDELVKVDNTMFTVWGYMQTVLINKRKCNVTNDYNQIKVDINYSKRYFEFSIPYADADKSAPFFDNFPDKYKGLIFRATNYNALAILFAALFGPKNLPVLESKIRYVLFLRFGAPLQKGGVPLVEWLYRNAPTSHLLEINFEEQVSHLEAIYERGEDKSRSMLRVMMMMEREKAYTYFYSKPGFIMDTWKELSGNAYGYNLPKKGETINPCTGEKQVTEITPDDYLADDYFIALLTGLSLSFYKQNPSKETYIFTDIDDEYYIEAPYLSEYVPSKTGNILLVQNYIPRVFGYALPVLDRLSVRTKSLYEAEFHPLELVKLVETCPEGKKYDSLVPAIFVWARARKEMNQYLRYIFDIILLFIPAPTKIGPVIRLAVLVEKIVSGIDLIMGIPREAFLSGKGKDREKWAFVFQLWDSIYTTGLTVIATVQLYFALAPAVVTYWGRSMVKQMLQRYSPQLMGEAAGIRILVESDSLWRISYTSYAQLTQRGILFIEVITADGVTSYRVIYSKGLIAITANGATPTFGQIKKLADEPDMVVNMATVKPENLTKVAGELGNSSSLTQKQLNKTLKKLVDDGLLENVVVLGGDTGFLIKISDESLAKLISMADDAKKISKRKRPSVCGVLEGKGQTIFNYSLKEKLPAGVFPEYKHKLVEQWVKDMWEKHLRGEIKLPEHHGKCAEVMNIDEYLFKIDPQSKFTLDQARKEFEGFVSHTRQIGDNPKINIKHGDYKRACDSCNPLLKHFNIDEYIIK